MGRMLGSFDTPEELDRPDLNKCPDCNCFFAGDNCPLCGKECPEEYRAGNRKAVKPQRKKRGGSGRVTFVEWYHSWWFIVVMMFIFPIVGIILLATSPHSRGKKITFCVIAAVYMVVSFIGIGTIIGGIRSLWYSPVDTSLSKEEYLASCENVSAEDFYRSSGEYEGKFISLELTVLTSAEYYPDYFEADKYTTCYICADDRGSQFYIIIRDCSRGTAKNFLTGDRITVWGEGAESISAYGGVNNEFQEYFAPTVNAAYIEIDR